LKPLFPSYLLIDFKNTAYRADAVGSANEQLKTSEGVNSGPILIFFRMIQKLKKEFGGELVFCMEGGEKLRYELFPDYKKNRKETPCFSDLIDLAKTMKCLIVTPKEAEADDAIATFIKNNEKARHCVISADKDLWSLLGAKTRIISFQQEITSKKVFDTFGVVAGAVPLAKALNGDSSDGLPSVPRLRWKDIEPILPGCFTPDDLYSRLDLIAVKTKEKLLVYKEQVELVYKLACLRSDCELDIQEFPGDTNGMTEILNNFECNSLLKSVSQLTT
jgi:5'-3' exonuclease